MKTRNLAAWSDPTPGEHHPGFVSINRIHGDQVAFMVRMPGHKGLRMAEIVLSAEAFASVLDQLNKSTNTTRSP